MPGKVKKIAVVLLVAILAGIATGGLAYSYGSRTLSVGSYGTDVVELQRRLRDLGYLEERGVDGIFGPQTRAGVAAFQRDYGLVSDGTAGRWTLGSVDRAFTWRNSVWYTVRPGDTLFHIAKRFGTDPDTIVWLNRLVSDSLYPGQVLRAPGRSDSVVAHPAGDDASQPDPPAPGGAAPGPGGGVPPPGLPADPAPPGGAAPAPTDPGGTLTQPDAPPGAAPVAPLPFPWLPPPLPPPPPVTDPILPPPQALTHLVLGYYTEDWDGDRRSLTSLQSSLDQVNLIVTFQYQIDGQGNLTGRDFPLVMDTASQKGQHVFALIHNYWNGGFSPDVVRQLLATPDSRQQTVDKVAALLRDKGFTGVNVDLEFVPPHLRDAYTDFVARLQAALKPLGLQVTLSIPAKVADDPQDSWSGAFDYKALAPLADLIVLMSYDENTPGWPAGPVASVGWVERVIAYAVGAIAPQKLLMGIPQYGYDWVKGTTQARALGVPAISQLQQSRGVTPAWDDRAKVPYFTYTDEQGRARIVYYENARSMKHKLDIMKRYQLRGIGIWKLGTEDPAIWPLIRQELR